MSDSQYSITLISLRDNAWKLMSFVNYDIIIHTAALVHNSKKDIALSEYDKVNYLLTLALAEKAKK